MHSSVLTLNGVNNVVAEEKKSIVYLGCATFPYGLAEMQKIILISKSLVYTGNEVTVLGKNGIHDKAQCPELKAHGQYENIEYVYASGSAYRSKNFFKRRLNEIKGAINETLFLRRRARRKQLDYAILTTRSFYAVLYYSLLGKLFGFKTILNYVEFYSAMKKKRTQWRKRLNDKLFDRYAPALTDAVFPISEFLIEHMEKVAPKKKYLKIPGLTDFDRYKGINGVVDDKYFLFCGDAAYKEIIQFIIDSFELLKGYNSIYLYLVINGSENNINEIKKYINQQPNREQIKLYSKLSSEQLFTYYKNALALLIPLRPTFQDMARFPHKTGEYLASGNPVISTNYGEVRYYFRDMENMLLAESYDVKLFAEKMQYVISHPTESKEIGLKGKMVASEIFEYRNRAGVINDFLKKEF